MASSGKKGKKTKGKTLALTEFLQEAPGATPTIPIRKTNVNWADEVEDVCEQYESHSKANVVLPTAPKASRGVDEYSDRIPNQGPYIAYLSNLPYDVGENDIADFFVNMKITNMRVPKEDRPGEAPRLKGFGYVEFEDRDSLLAALAIPDCTLRNRRIRIEVATNLDNDRRRGGRMDSNRDRPDRPEVTSGDWRSGPRADLPEPERRGGGGFNRDRERDGAGERDRSWRDGGDRPSFRDSDREKGFSRDSDRDRGFSRDSDRGFSRDSDRGGMYRDGQQRDGFGGDRGRYGDRDSDRRGFGPRRSDRDDREISRGSRDDGLAEKSEPRTRQKLVLAPRTKPVEAVVLPAAGEKEPEVLQEPAAAPVPAASIFGCARPVDTSIRERQIEDRLARENEKPAQELSRDGRREDDRKDWGRRRDDSPKGSSDRRTSSPRRSPSRRSSPRRSPPRRFSPRRNSPRRSSPRRSLPRRSSPRRSSPKRSPREYSPEHRQASLDRRSSSEGHSGSPDARQSSAERRSPERQKSPDHLETNRVPPPRKNDERDRKGPSKGERPPPRDKNDKDKSKRDDRPSRDVSERELPRLKEPEPPNFAASNKFAYLPSEESSD